MPSCTKLIALAVFAVLVRLAMYRLIAIPFGGLSAAMCQYDCGWYMRLAAVGYGSDSFFADYADIPNFAFFPLYPILLRASMAVIHMSSYFVGILLSNALFVGFILLSVTYLRRTRMVFDPYLWVVFIVLFPFGFTFSAVYSESLFALLIVAAVLALQQRRILLCACLTAALCATRPTGVLMLPLIIGERAQHLWVGRHRTDRVALIGETLLPIAIAPLGLSLYMLFQYLTVGDAVAFSHVQILWDRAWVGPLANIVSGLAAWDWYRVLSPKGLQSSSYSVAWALLGLAASGWMAWRRRFIEAWLCAASILLPLSTALHSLPRFVATNPFFLFALFDFVVLVRNRLAVACLFGTAGLLHGVVIVGWFIAASSLY
jgi:hypothetical protein